MNHYILTTFILSLSILVFAGLSFDARIVHAQTSFRSETISLTSSPQYPQPHETVEVSVKGDGFSVHQDEIRWYRNGTLQQRTRGGTTFTFNAPSVGERIAVRAVVVRDNDSTVEETIVVQPADVDLIWEAQTYTPPFYNGKSLRSPTARSYVVAKPYVYNRNGQLISERNLNFTWTFNGRTLGSFSGYGKNVFQSDVSPRPNNVQVRISTREGRTVAQKGVTIPNTEARAYMYPVDPLMGVDFSHSLTHESQLSTDEITLHAYPYHFDISETRARDLKYQWEMNGESLEGATNPTITLENSGESGATDISVSIRNIHRSYQLAEQEITLILPRNENETQE